MAPRVKGWWWYVGACASLMGALFLGGCAEDTDSLDEQAELSRSLSQQNLDFQVVTERRLTEVADSIDRSLAELATIERARTPKKKNKKLVTVNSQELESKTVSLDWNGPVAPLLQRVAKLINYQLRVIGKTPAVPILVSVNGYDISAADLLRGVDLQCGQRARVVVYAKQKMIELRYYE